MSRSIQIICAFSFGVTFVGLMLVIALLSPYPSTFQLFTFRIVLALAAGGVAAMLPGFLTVNIPNVLRAGGALAAFAVVYFFNPAELGVEGRPTNTPGVFVKKTSEDDGLAEYYWKQADVTFRFPAKGWSISTKAAAAGLGDMTLQYGNDKDAQIQLHVSLLDEKYRNKWDEFETNTISIWKGTISQFGPFSTQNVFVDGRKSFRMTGTINGPVQGMKRVDLLYAPLGDNRLFEMHLTRNSDHTDNEELLNAFNLIISTIKFDRD